MEQFSVFSHVYSHLMQFSYSCIRYELNQFPFGIPGRHYGTIITLLLLVYDNNCYVYDNNFTVTDIC